MRLPAFVCLSVCMSVCLLARLGLLKNACMDLDEMLRVDRWGTLKLQSNGPLAYTAIR